MKISVQGGKYVLAVSGGVDSMVLFDLLAGKPEAELVVAHFNHGIRPDSAKDEELVAARAKQLGKRFEVGYGHLGKGASEAAARTARYRFFESVRLKHGADAVITAHHQDDLIETAILNVLRGTGRKGLTAISSNRRIIRPLLEYKKSQILNYAERNHLQWREDSTNGDNAYLRNYIRNNWLADMAVSDRQKLISNIEKVAKTEMELDSQIAKVSQIICRGDVINRQKFNNLPAVIENELMAYWFRRRELSGYDRGSVNRISTALKVARPGTRYPLKSGLALEVGPRTARFVNSL